MVSPDQKRAAARALQERGRPPAIACRTVSLARSTFYYEARERPGEAALLERIRALAARFPRFGYRRITVMLRREGFLVNTKRVQRLWQAEGLQIRRKRRSRRWKRQEPWPDRARCRNHVWTVDFVFDRTLDGRPLKILSVVDEFTREVVALHSSRSITAADVKRVLDHAASKRGTPAFIRSDNGPEFVALAVRSWSSGAAIEMRYIAPGSPWQNGCVESFHDKLRDELLQLERFCSLAEARVVIEGWRKEYNDLRPHSSLGYLTPSEFAARPCGADSASLRHPRRGAYTQPNVT